MKKALSLLLSALLLLSLAACGSSSKPEPVVAAFCDALKLFDLDKASTYFETSAEKLEDPYSDDENAEDDIMSDQAIEYLKKCAGNMTYSVGEATVEDTTAKVPVTFTYVDASPVVTAALGDYIAQAFALAFSGADDSVLEDLFGTIFIEKTESVTTGTATCSVVFNCIQVDKEWKIREFDGETEDQLTNLMTCNIAKAFEGLSDLGDEEYPDDTDDSLSEEEYAWHNVEAGQVLELATIKMRITNCEELGQLTAEYYDPDVAQEGTKYVVLTVEIENITKSTMELNNDFVLVDNQDREYEPYSDAFWYYDETFTYTDLAPNIPKTGVFVYNVPEDSAGYYLITAKAGTNDAYRLYAQ